MKKNFWCPDPAAAAGAVAEQWPESARVTCHIADDICANRFLFRDRWEMERTRDPVDFGPGEENIRWDFIPAGDPEWLYAMNRHTSFVNLAKGWLLTGEKRYPEKFSRLIQDWIDRVPLSAASEQDTWRSLEAGLRCENWLRALELLEGSGYPQPELRKKIEDCLTVHGDYLVRASSDFHLLSNWGILQDHGLFLLGVYFDRQDWQALALRRMDENLHRSVFRDGSHWEQSPLYHCEVLHNLLDVLHAARRRGIKVPDTLTRSALRMSHALAAWVKPDGLLPCQSDSDQVDARDVLAAAALLFQDSSLKAAAGEMFFPENLWDFGPEGEAAYAALRSHPARPDSAILSDSGNVMFRGPKGAWAHMHCGCLGSGHGHADLLHLDAGIAGEDVLIDPGRCTYLDSPLRRQLKSPGAHNTTRVDGLDFSTCIDSWGYDRLAIPLKGEHCFTPAADYASGFHLGYLDRGAVVGRKVVFLREEGVLVLFDLLYGTGPHTFEQNFHFGPGKVTATPEGAIWQGRASSARLLCLGDDLEQVWQRHPYALEYNHPQEGDHLILCREARGFNWFVTVLSMDPESQPQPVTARLLPVRRLRRGDLLEDSQAQALQIIKEGRETLLLACHAEIISEVDLFSAGGYSGYGKLLVFSPENPLGLCLAW